MTDYRNILFAADFIEDDDDIVSLKAQSLARQYGADLSIVHVLEMPTIYGEACEATYLVECQEHLKKEATNRIKKIGNEMGIPEKQQYLRLGQTKMQILEVAEESGADLIVMGSHGRRGIGLLLLGSTTQAVLNHAKCDVLAVRV